MRIEKAVHSLVCVGPGGRKCPCCAPKSVELKRREHKASRQTERAQVRAELMHSTQEGDSTNGK